ncbi:MAG: hypothetical protein QOE26_3262 [Verrucomicrobiota bacterium]|jgi:hypothetical protein
MSLGYRDQLKLVIIDKALLGLLILFAGFVFTLCTDAFKNYLDRQDADRRSAIAYHERRLSELLYPLYYLTREDDVVYDQMYEKGSKPPKKTPFGLLVEKQAILPNHQKISALLGEKSFLLGRAAELTGKIEQYERHVAILATLRASGSTSDPYEFDNTAGYPDFFSSAVAVEIRRSEEKITELSIIRRWDRKGSTLESRQSADRR